MKNPFESFLEDTASTAKAIADEAAKAATETVSKIVGTVGSAANDAVKGASETTAHVAEAAAPIVEGTVSVVSELRRMQHQPLPKPQKRALLSS